MLKTELLKPDDPSSIRMLTGMAYPAHYWTCRLIPFQFVFMATFTAFMKRHIQSYGNLLSYLFLMAAGAFAPFSVISIEIQPEIMMARPAANDSFM